MPYIKPEAREALRKFSTWDPKVGSRRNLSGPGDLNYLITTLCDQYAGMEPNYERLNEVMGVLECAKLEFYRRVCAAYEDKKIKENGDVYTVEHDCYTVRGDGETELYAHKSNTRTLA